MKDSVRDVLHFWFEETAPVQWFQVNEAFDRLVTDRFLDLYRIAVKGVCDAWVRDMDGALALVLLFDQFPRNMFRGTQHAFSTDAQAREVARRAIALGFDQLASLVKRRFFYLPFEHSEDMKDQERSLALFGTIKDYDPLSYEYAVRHFTTIKLFGRFPHRNIILGRESTPEELDFLATGSK